VRSEGKYIQKCSPADISMLLHAALCTWIRSSARIDLSVLSLSGSRSFVFNSVIPTLSDLLNNPEHHSSITQNTLVALNELRASKDVERKTVATWTLKFNVVK